MRKALVALGIVAAGSLAFGASLHDDPSTGAITVPVFDTASGTLEPGQYAFLEDGKTIYVHTTASSTDYLGPVTPETPIATLTQVSLIGHKDIGVFNDAAGRSYRKDVNPDEADKIRKGEKVTKKGLSFGTPRAFAAIANTASKTFAGVNLVTSSTTAISITSGETVTYGGFNNINSLNSMSLSCTSGTVIKANTGVVLSGAGNSHFWAVTGASTGTATCTITATSSAFFLVQESNYTGTSNDTSVIDAQTSSSCSATTSCSTSVTTITDNAWTVIFAGVSSGAPSAGAGTTVRVSDANGVGLADSNAGITPPASSALVLTRPGSSGFATNMMALKPAAAATADKNDATIRW